MGGRDLEGRFMDLPHDLGGVFNLLVLTFDDGQQEDVAEWMEAVEPLRAGAPFMTAYELPILSSALVLAQPWIDRGLAESARDSSTRDRTVTVYVNKRAFVRRAGLAGTDSVQVLLLDRDGDIIWRAHGPPCLERLQELCQSLGLPRGVAN
jgi:hypothetical protein